MYSFIVLGNIPGTNFVISFQLWLELFALIISLAILQLVHSDKNPTTSRQGGIVVVFLWPLLTGYRSLEVRFLMLYSRLLVPLVRVRAQTDFSSANED